jgi:hypothetical protein
MATNIEYLHADQIGGCVTLISTETTKICGRLYNQLEQKIK